MLRSTFAGLNTMVSGVQTSRLSLETVGHNISNTNTEGYSRQSANAVAVKGSQIYTSVGPQIIGNGTDVASITRARDIYADRQYWKENASSGYFDSRYTNYSKLEVIFNDTDDNGIQNALEDFYKSWSLPRPPLLPAVRLLSARARAMLPEFRMLPSRCRSRLALSMMIWN